MAVVTSLDGITPTDAEDDLAPTFVSDTQDKEIQELERGAEQYMASTPDPTDTQKKEPPVADEDPWDIRIWRTIESIGDTAGSFALGVGHTLIETPTAVPKGAYNAVRETLISLDDLANWLNGSLSTDGQLEAQKEQQEKNVERLKEMGAPDVVTEIVGEEGARAIPEAPPSESVGGNMVQGFSQFVTGFIPMLRGIKAVSGARVASSALGKAAQIEAAAATSPLLTFSAHEQRLSNLIQEFPMTANPITEYLAADPNDSTAEGKFKTAIEGLGLGGIGLGLTKALRAIKINRIATGMETTKMAERADETGHVLKPAELKFIEQKTPANDPDFRVFEDANTGHQVYSVRYSPDLAKPSETAIGWKVQLRNKDGLVRPEPVFKTREEAQDAVKAAEEAAAAVRLGEGDKSLIKPDLGPAEEGAGFMTKEAADQFQAMSYDDLNSASLAHSINWHNYTSPADIKESLDALATVLSGKIDDVRRGTIGDKELRRLADDLGMTPEDLLKRQPGEAFNAERIVAARMLVEAATMRMNEMAEIARFSTDASDLYNFYKMFNINSALYAQFQGAASEVGRALRATRIPTGSKHKQLQMIAETFMGQGGAKNIRKLADAVSRVKDPDDFKRAMRGSLGKRIMDAVIEFWYFSLLSGPQTHAVNVTSNAVNLMWQIGERSLSAQAAKVLRGADNVEVGEATQMMYGLVEALRPAITSSSRVATAGHSTRVAAGLQGLREGGIREGLERFKATEAIDEPVDPMLKTEARVDKAITAQNLGFQGAEEGSVAEFTNKAINGLGYLTRSTTRGLMAEDTFFKTIAKHMQKRALAFRQAKSEGLEGEALAARTEELVREPTSSMEEAAVDFARDATFTRPLGNFGRGIQTGLNKVPPLKLLVPFVRTVGNLGKWAGKRTPLGVASAKVRADIAAGGVRRQEALTRMAVGSAVMLTAVDMAIKGLITGAGPADPDLRRTWRRTHAPFSIKIGDTWYSYNRADPFGMLLGVAASYGEIGGQLMEGDIEEITTAAVVATSRSVFSKTWMRGPSDAIAAATQPELYGERWVHQMIGSFLVPTGKAQMTRIEDPVWREVNSTLDALKARFGFGYSKELPAMRNLWGEKILLEGGLGPDIVSPIYKYGVKDSPVDTWMFENRVNVRLPERTQGGVELTPKEYEEFQVLAGHKLKLDGKGLKETLDEMVAGKGPDGLAWKEGSDGPEGFRAQLILDKINLFRQAALLEMIETNKEFREKYNYRIEEKAALLEGGRLPELPEGVEPKGLVPGRDLGFEREGTAPSGYHINERGELEIDNNTPRGGIVVP